MSQCLPTNGAQHRTSCYPYFHVHFVVVVDLSILVYLYILVIALIFQHKIQTKFYYNRGGIISRRVRFAAVVRHFENAPKKGKTANAHIALQHCR